MINNKVFIVCRYGIINFSITVLFFNKRKIRLNIIEAQRSFRCYAPIK